MTMDSSDPLSGDRALRGLRPVQAASVLEARTKAARREEHHVVLGLQDRKPSPEVVQALCQGFGWDTWSTLRRLESPTPRLVRREASQATALYWVGWMRELGLRAFALKESRLAGLRVHEAVSLSIDGPAILVAASNGTLHRVAPEEVLCLVAGEPRLRIVQTRQGRGKITRQVVRDEAEAAFDVHLRSGEAVLRFRQSALRYAEFLQMEEAGSLRRFARVRELVQQAAPGLRLHGDFAAAAGSLGESWRLVSRSRDMETHRGGTPTLADVEVVELDEWPLFQLWSALLRFQQEAGE